MQRDVIAVRVERRQIHQCDAQILGDLRGDIRIVRLDAHLERARALHHFPADAAQPDDAQRLAAQLAAHELLLFPLAAGGGLGGLRNAPRHGQHQRQGVLRHGNGIASRRVHHQDAGRRGGFQIHVVDAHARAADHPQLGRVVEHRLIHLHGAAHDQRIRFRQVIRVFLGTGNDHVPAGLRLQKGNCSLGEWFRNQNCHACTACGATATSL